MSANRHLQSKQFSRAHIEGKAASDWLATDAGHGWQDTNFGHDAPHEGGNMVANHPAWHENSPRANDALEHMNAGVYRPNKATNPRTGL